MLLCAVRDGSERYARNLFVGTVAGFKAESAEIEVKPDQGDTVSLKITTATQVQRVPPGEKDLKKAEPIQDDRRRRRAIAFW